MILSPNQVAELMALMDNYFNVFIVHNVGSDFLSDTQKDTLLRAGIDITMGMSHPEEAFKFGILSQMMNEDSVKHMSYGQFKNYVVDNRFRPLNSFEQATIQSLNYQTVSDLERAKAKMQGQVRDSLVFADKQNNTVKHSNIVTEAAEDAIRHNKSISTAISDIGHKTKQWDKDLGRIVDYVMHTAFDEGRAAEITRKEGSGAMVYKDVYQGACAHCQRLLLTGAVGSAPKLFKLSELTANGTNVGKKVKDWKATLGPVHPWCRCTLMNTPFGFTEDQYNKGWWEWRGGDFRKTSEWSPVVRRKSKAIINITKT